MIALPNFAVIGKAGAGKDTVAEVLMEAFPHLGYQRFALADPLKDIAASLWGDEARRSRHYLQGLGVSVRELNKDTWVDHLFRRIGEAAPFAADDHRPGRIIVTDCRFANELQRFREEGFTVLRVEAPQVLRVDRLRRNGKLQDEAELEHVSETELDGARADHTIINDASKFDLVDQLTEILNRESR